MDQKHDKHQNINPRNVVTEQDLLKETPDLYDRIKKAFERHFYPKKASKVEILGFDKGDSKRLLCRAKVGRKVKVYRKIIFVLKEGVDNGQEEKES
jgi:hypothetical protein